MHNQVAVIGAGAWGSAVAHLLASNGQWVCLYTHEEAVAHEINQQHTNQHYLPDIQLPPTIWATTDYAKVALAKTLFMAVPVPYVREVLSPLRGLVTREHTLVALCKGIENNTLRLPFELIGESVGMCNMAVVGGPNFATDLVRQTTMGTVIASRLLGVAQHVEALLKAPYVRTVLSDDPLGVQLCGALKNLVAIAVGIVAGQGGSDNTRAYVLTQGLADIASIVHARGGRRSVVYGLAGVGDTVLSSGTQGRNYRLGVALGKGEPLAAAVAQFASPPEGVNTAQSMRELIARYQFEVPILSATCAAVLDGIPFCI